jgi:hypothetical protein
LLSALPPSPGAPVGFSNEIERETSPVSSKYGWVTMFALRCKQQPDTKTITHNTAPVTIRLAITFPFNKK